MFLSQDDLSSQTLTQQEAKAFIPPTKVLVQNSPIFVQIASSLNTKPPTPKINFYATMWDVFVFMIQIFYVCFVRWVSLALKVGKIPSFFFFRSRISLVPFCSRR